jgi:hypothetical protein
MVTQINMDFRAQGVIIPNLNAQIAEEPVFA